MESNKQTALTRKTETLINRKQVRQLWGKVVEGRKDGAKNKRTRDCSVIYNHQDMEAAQVSMSR